MRSFSILRTNVGLTTNVKIIVDSTYNMYLESIDSNPELSNIKLKNFKFNKDNYYDELLPYFWKGVSSDLAFDIKYDKDNDIMSNDYSSQYDEIYNYGAKNIVNNKNYTEEYEYFAPLYLNSELPSNFIIFRVDGSGMINLTKDNFTNEILNKLKVVKVFDLNKKTELGSWLDKSFIENKDFPYSPLEIDFNKYEFSKWNGIDYNTGGYVSKSLFMDSTFEKERELFEFDKKINENWKKQEVVFPSILNMTFLFDDTPSTPDLVRKWSLNRYYGFYVDKLDLVTTLSPYKPNYLIDGCYMTHSNIIVSENGDPFVDGFKTDKKMYIEYNGVFYVVERYFENGITELAKINNENYYIDDFQESKITKYKIISDVSISDINLINKKIGSIKNGYLVDINGDSYIIDNFEDSSIWLIEMGGEYFNLIKDTNGVKINSDLSFEFYDNYYTKKIAGQTIKIEYNTTSFNIFRLELTDIRDFDTKIVDTDYSKYEYEKYDELTKTDEPKMYVIDYESKNNPKDLDDYKYKNELINIPVTSEYMSTYEIFKIKNKDLSDIWRKNNVHSRWGYKGSLSFNDRPYLLNNSLVFEDFNKCADIYNPNPNRSSRNLDYFYTINSSTFSYLHHSLHVEKVEDYGIDISHNFDVSSYLTTSNDYFKHFFEYKQTFDKNTTLNNVRKYSYFNRGDKSIPNSTLFKGIKFEIYDVVDIKKENNKISIFNLNNKNNFEDYKFSIILTQGNNDMEWLVIENWVMDKEFKSEQVVVYEDILYVATSTNTCTNPLGNNGELSNPSNMDEFFIMYQNPNSHFFNPGVNYILEDFVYNNGDYYYCINTTANIDFYNPSKIYSGNSYNLDDIVLYKGEYYKSLINDNILSPKSSTNWEKTLKPDDSLLKWKLVELWNPIKPYPTQAYVVYNNILYKGVGLSGDRPGFITSWVRIYSYEQDTNFLYTPTNNAFVSMNNNYYQVLINSNGQTLENGIKIYINKKYKNILVNIFVNDNTLSNLSNTDRDYIYTDLYKKLTANNFINSINDLGNKNNYSDFLTYIIMDENGKVDTYNWNNINKLPYIIRCVQPNEIYTMVNSLIKYPISLNNILKPTKVIKNGELTEIKNLRYYNNLAISVDIVENLNQPLITDIYSDNKNITFDTLYRYGGYYTPIFYDIDLFDKSVDGNYKFDTTLSNFGLMKERIIQKVNLKENIFKLRNSNNASIYPMFDEFGYTYTDFFIFKSSFDKSYYIGVDKEQEVINTKNVIIDDKTSIEDFGIDNDIFKNNFL